MRKLIVASFKILSGRISERVVSIWVVGSSSESVSAMKIIFTSIIGRTEKSDYLPASLPASLDIVSTNFRSYFPSFPIL